MYEFLEKILKITHLKNSINQSYIVLINFIQELVV